MILSVTVPRAAAQASRATVHRLMAKPGDALSAGTPLFEIMVDLGNAGAQDCPPKVFLRLIATERAVLRTLSLAPGDTVEPGEMLGVATTSSDEGAAGTPGRALRTTSIAVQVDPLAEENVR